LEEESDPGRGAEHANLQTLNHVAERGNLLIRKNTAPGQRGGGGGGS